MCEAKVLARLMERENRQFSMILLVLACASYQSETVISGRSLCRQCIIAVTDGMHKGW